MMDDHCWLTVHGEAWAIRFIQRYRDGVTIGLWRGVEPDIEYAVLVVRDWDFEAYCEAAAAQLTPN